MPLESLAWVAMIYLVIATVGAFLLYLFVLGRWTASGTSYAFVLTPITTVILASIVTDETISLVFLIGAAVVLSGVYIGALMPARKKAAPQKPAAPEELPETVEPVVAGAPVTAAVSASENIQARPGAPTCF